jgi:mannosyl-3-phosphoglycerate phosphatase
MVAYHKYDNTSQKRAAGSHVPVAFRRGCRKVGEPVKRAVVFTDLDGTLLDARTYSFAAALPALGMLREQHVPLVICSSKTRSEIEHYREDLGNGDPFISENGGAVFVPRGYFASDTGLSVPAGDDDSRYLVLRLGARYKDLRGALTQLREEGFDVRGFGDMTAEEIAAVTGLPLGEAVMAGKREFDEPFLFGGDLRMREELAASIERKGFRVTQGFFHHILGESDKGKAVSIVAGMFRREYGEIVTAALGDSPNDLPMLRSVDRPIIVEKHGGGYDRVLAAENFERAEGEGPEGWNRAVIELLGDL